jgi:hypothetical protein
MKRSALEVYALAVCFFTVACFVVTFGIGLYDVVQIAAPEFAAPPVWDEPMMRPPVAKGDTTVVLPSEAELEEMRRSRRESSIENEKRRAQQSLVQMAIIVAIDIGIFMAHWKLAQKARANAAA